MNDPKTLWNKILETISTQVSSTTISTWFSRANLNKLNNGVAVIGCADPFVREWIESKHRILLTETISQLVGNHIAVTFVIDENLSSKEAIEKTPLFSTGKDENSLIKVLGNSNINIRYSFESFIVGPSNRLAHAAAEAVAARPGATYNPLFIYGGVGLGKTHLMHAIGNRMLNDNPNRKIYYCASETFLNSMVEAIRSGKTTEFRQKYRKLDLLIIDDIQFISNWQETQSELFHTFNELYLANKQIVFASDRPPSQISNLMDRLRSRFEGGMVADISEPTYEMRIAILKKKCEQNLIHLPEECINSIASSVESNIRELEGALNRIYNQKTVTGIIPTPAEIENILKRDIEQKQRQISPKKVIKAVAKEFNVTVKELKGSSRRAQIAKPRQVAMFIIREDLKHKLEDIAGFLGKTDHTTVLNAVKRVSSLILKDDTVREKIERLRQRIRQNTL
ncbi:chromosomal replication initiator protein DnaA [Candidatus Dojkabacteria bacterium]|nr:chromosomal replication initiator protein DnaA [Candidatus Dojkabacteria bacterium]